MKIDKAFLRSKVARRMFILFICCSLIPIIALSVLSYNQISRQLNVRSQRQLHQTSKDIGLYIYDRLLFLETEMKMVASRIESTQHSGVFLPAEELNIDLEHHFHGFALIKDEGTPTPLFGSIKNIPVLSQDEKQNIQSGNSVLSTIYHQDDHVSSIFMSMALDPQNPGRGILLGELNPTYLWGIGGENPWLPTAEFCILDHSNTILFSTLSPPLLFPEKAVQTMDANVSGQFEWEHEKNQYLAGYWSLFLKTRYYTTEKWTVVLSEAKTDVLAPTATFKTIFPLVILTTLWVVILLSINLIRRNLVPLEKLQEGTRHITQGKFDSHVTIKTGDEFEELAASFNIMADRLGKQFKTLTTITDIDRAILSTLDTDNIIEVVLNRIHEILPCDCISVILFYFGDQDSALTYMKEKSSGIGKEVETVILKPIDTKELFLNPEFLIIDEGHKAPGFLAPLAKRGNKSFFVLPLFVNQMLSGIIALGYQTPPTYEREDINLARQLADQVAVALSNTRLVEELEQLHWGSLTALARAIDAKSRWATGHSERVTKLVIKIGAAMGLPPEELDILHRGGLLHDIGKIGVPADILDKTGKLSEREKDFIREHVRWGARILEPIAAFADILPIVLQHHEHFDGSGYPEGLAGEAIHLNARIFAVADTFDALTSHRPYREAMSTEQAIEIIIQGSGSQFDPKVVRAFLDIIAEEAEKDEYTIKHVAESM
jgi:putative nucleotidyltransferase with HDIG domain